MKADTVLKPSGCDPPPPPLYADERPATQSGSSAMRLLPETFKQGGWGFQQLARSTEICLYLKSKPAAGGGLIRSWEVVVPNRCKARWFPSGKSYAERESYPRTAQWGSRGWTYTSEAEAHEAFNRRTALRPVCTAKEHAA